MHTNEIIEEIHKYREEYARSFNYDLNAMFEDLRKKQIASGRKFVKLPIRRRSDKSMQTK
ncbi:MAG: hypothetical protein KME17_02900 [Cyanosarcina radialis HA8281-LM2]|jgi:hypothetical protein|nr:hypothetical protein [Cyanosarcina radialis HA8281-LM2]